MSAIAGLVRFDERPMTGETLDPAMRALAGLGPDRRACWHDGTAALGACLMTVLPEDRFDRQPWLGRDGTLVLVADARIDNRDELGRALGLGADRLVGMADSEMLLEAHGRWGAGGLDRVVGEFTFAAWDARDRRLFCARSQLGGAPLYYHAAQRFFAFASTADALIAVADIPRILNERHLACALTLLPGDQRESYFRDIFCLPPGYCLSVAGGRVTVERYWRLDVTRRIRLSSDADYVEAFRDIFERAVAARLRSIAPVGAHLSSGCDSSAVTATAAHLLAAEQRELTAFTAAPREGYAVAHPGGRTIDESPLAAEFAATLPNATHVVLRPDDRTALDVLGRSQPLYGLPIRNPANFVWIERILDEARSRGIRVLLTGAQGNMTISYPGLSLMETLLREGRWPLLAREARALRRQGFSYRGIVDATLGPSVPEVMRRLVARRSRRADTDATTYAAINPDFAVDIGIAALARGVGWKMDLQPIGDARTRRRALIEAQEISDYGGGMRAGWGIDMRDPTSDRRVVEFCLAIPEEQLLRHGMTKFLYRRAFEPVLPAAAVAARKRGYQAADWHESLTAARGRIEAEIERFDRSATARRVLDLPRLRRLVANWPTGDWHRDDVTTQYRLVLMRGIAMGLFIRAAEGGGE